MISLLLGDCLHRLRELEDNSIDSIVTDPPYGLSFMGKKWDYDVPGVDVWAECLRVLKPGGHLLSFAGTRTQHRMAVRIEDAGFEIRDMIAWVYGSGFPKSHNLRDDWQGWGTALKPALEPITVARKPLIGTVAENVLTHGTGALNIDGCRVHGDDAKEGRTRHGGGIVGNASSYELPDYQAPMPAGRWPANLIHDGSEEVVGLFPETAPAKAAQRGAGINGATFKAPEYESTERGHDDAGGTAARFFYCAKADASERRQSKHPTIKPVALMRYLVRLVTPPGGLVLDPFGGSGTTAEAARLEHCRFLLMELSPEYCADAAERLRQGVLF